jgi:hypothetical protein
MSSSSNNNISRFDEWLTDSIMKYVTEPHTHITNVTCNELKMYNTDVVLTPQLLGSIFKYARNISSDIKGAECTFLPNVNRYRDKCMVTLAHRGSFYNKFTSRDINSQVDWFLFCTRVKPCDGLDIPGYWNQNTDGETLKIPLLSDLYRGCEFNPYIIKSTVKSDGVLVDDKNVIYDALYGSIRIIKSNSLRLCHAREICKGLGVEYGYYNGMYQWSCLDHEDSKKGVHPYITDKDQRRIDSYIQSLRLVEVIDHCYNTKQMAIEAFVDNIIRHKIEVKHHETTNNMPLVVSHNLIIEDGIVDDGAVVSDVD